MISKSVSDRIHAVKAMLILCTVYAHVISTNEVYAWIMKLIGTLGVPSFFVLSGYFFNYEKYRFIDFWKSKVKKVIIPWLLWGMATYMFSVIIGEAGNVFEGLKWIVGVGTWYYYISVMLILELLFYKVNKDWICVIGIFINIISILLYRYKLFANIEWSTYVNIFNWCGFFASGILIKRYNILEKIIKFADKNIITIAVAFCIVVLIQYKAEILPTYIAEINILIELLGGLFILALSKYLSWKYIINIGKQTFIIYLIHMQIVQAISTRIPNYGYIDLIKPIMGLVIVYICVCTISYILSKLRLNKLKPFIGIK